MELYERLALFYLDFGKWVHVSIPFVIILATALHLFISFTGEELNKWSYPKFYALCGVLILMLVFDHGFTRFIEFIERPQVVATFDGKNVNVRYPDELQATTTSDSVVIKLKETPPNE
jgi:hypothetical protein